MITASLAGLLFGFDTAVIARVTHSLRVEYSLSPAGLGATVSSALGGTLVGALAAGGPGDRFGSRSTLRFIGGLYTLAALGCALAWNLPSFVAFRFLVGLAIGASSVLAPLYISEIAPAERRGALVGLFQFNIVLAVTLAMFNQLSGINAILYYLGDSFAAAGFSSMSANLQSVAIGATNLVATLIGMAVIDWLGRKALLLIGAVGTAVALAGVSVIMGLQTHRALLLPLLIGFMALQFVVVWVAFPETKGVSLERMAERMG